MKRSTQIGLAAAGVLLVATIWSRSDEDTQENLVYNSLSDCRAGGQLSAQQCETAFSEATAARLKDAPLLPPTAAACPPGSPQPECQQARAAASSSSSSSGSSGSYGSSRSRAYSTTNGRGFTAAFASGSRGGSISTTRVSSRGGFGSIAHSFSSHSSS